VHAVVCLNVLEHIDDDTAAMSHIARILKPGGIAHIEVPSGPHLYDVYDELLMHHRRYRMSGLVRLVQSTGLEVVRKTHLGFFVFPAFAATKLANRWRRRSPAMQKKDMVVSRIRKTSGSSVFRFLLSLENRLGLRVQFPFGIRCVLVARKPPR
jgi:SAM-dependent methyltransferase